MKLVEVILGEMNNISKFQKKFFIILMKTIVSVYGKVNFRNLSRYSGITEKTFRRWFKKSFDFGEFNSRAINKVVTPESELVASFDQSFNGKSGKKTWGKDYFWNGCASKAEKGLELGLCTINDVGKNTAYALAADQTPSTDELKKKLGDNSTRIDFYLDCIEKHRFKILSLTKYFAFDGYFAKKKFVDGIVEKGFYFIGKLRCDANLKILYTGKQKEGRGRPRKFAGKCDVSKLQNFTFDQAIDSKTEIYFGIFYHTSLERNIKVVAVKHLDNKKTRIVLLFSTDLKLPSLKILQYYKLRFQIEFVFRDAKQYVGLCDCQSRNKESLHFHFNASFTALNLVKIKDQLDQMESEKNKPFSMLSHKIRYYNENLIGRFFSRLAPGVTLIKSSSVFKEMLNYGAINFR